MKAIINRGYQPYQGIKYPRPLRFWPILRNEIVSLWKLKRVRFFVYSFLLVAFFFGSISIIIEFFLKSIEPSMNTPPFVKALNTKTVYKQYQDYMLWLLFIFCAIVGGGLISNDLKTKAMPLYFSKPLGWSIYLLGKTMIIALAVFFISFIPGLFIFFIKILISTTPMMVFQEEYRYVLGMFLNSLFILVVLTPIILAISSFTESYNIAMISFIMLLIFLGGVAGFFAVNDPEGYGKNSLAVDIAFCLKHSSKKFFPDTTEESPFQLPTSDRHPRRKNQIPLPDKVENEFWIQFNLGCWVFGSMFLLLRRLRKIEVAE